MTSSGSINNQYGPYGAQQLYGTGYESGGYNNLYSNPQENLTYFQGYQSPNQDGYNSNYGLYGPEASTSTPQQPKMPLNDATALARIQGIAGELDKQVTGETDSKIDLQDLQKAVADDSGKYTKEQKEAIQYLIDNQNGMRGRLDSFDGKGDSVIQVDTLNKLVANPNAQPEKTAEQKMTNTEAIRIYKDYLGSRMMKGMDREEISRLAESDKISEDERTAFKKLLSNKALFDAADTGKDKNNKYDGYISIKDADSLLNRSDLDQIGGGSGSGNGAGGYNGQPVIQSDVSSYPPVSTGNSNLDYYYNSVFGSSVGPASDAYRQAMGGQQAA